MSQPQLLTRKQSERFLEPFCGFCGFTDIEVWIDEISDNGKYVDYYCPQCESYGQLEFKKVVTPLPFHISQHAEIKAATETMDWIRQTLVIEETSQPHVIHINPKNIEEEIYQNPELAYTDGECGQIVATLRLIHRKFPDMNFVEIYPSNPKMTNPKRFENRNYKNG